jgi:hypothetical protein
MNNIITVKVVDGLRQLPEEESAVGEGELTLEFSYELRKVAMLCELLSEYIVDTFSVWNGDFFEAVVDFHKVIVL